MTRRRQTQILGIIAVATGAALLAWAAFGTRTGDEQGVVLAEMAAIAPPSPDAPDDFPAIVDSAVRDPADRVTPVGATFEIIETLAHDTEAFTQGLEIHDGRLFESTGLNGASSIRELNLSTGDVVRNVAVPEVFAEGLTVLGETTIQLTWKDGEAYRYNTDTFTRTDTYFYDGEGWGICDDGARLIMSNGSPTLQFRDPTNFELLDTIEVRYGSTPVDELNELECVDGNVWANIWQSSLIVEIEPETGNVVTVLNARALTPSSVEGSSSDVLNGIAYDPTDGTFLLTGKRWPTIYRVRIDRLAQ